MDELRSALSAISFDLIRYEDGDLMALAALVDSLQAARALAVDEVDGRAAQKLFELARGAITGEDFPAARLSEGLDRLQDWISARESGQPALSVRKSLEEWVAGPGATDEEAVQGEPLAIFLSEARERLVEAQGLVLELEQNPADRVPIDSLFRTFHTIKGECGFLKIRALGEVAHHIESLLESVREGRAAREDTADLLFEGIDVSMQLLSDLQTGEAGSSSDHGALLKKLKDAAAAGIPIGQLFEDAGKLSEDQVQGILAKQKESAYSKKFGEIAVEEALASPQEVNELLQKQGHGPLAHEAMIKVRASQVNYLVDMIGELLIIQNQLDDQDRRTVELKKIARTIQGAAMSLRTVGLKNLFVSLKRISRDAANQLQKSVRFETSGDDLEIDRNLVECLEEPLMHMVRNCIGHGIESPAERLSSGKPEAGTVQVSARRRGNNIVISVRDDGAGLDEEKILNKAILKGLVPESSRETIGRNEVLNLIFHPGFSTADTVNAISGRGVGMDIVKTAVAGARGRIETRSEKGQYTEFSLVFPLSLAIIDGMVVRTEGTHYILPIANIVETMTIVPGQLQSVEGRSQVINLRQEILPVISVSEYFFDRRTPLRETFAIVIDFDDKKYALLVEAVIAKKEVVIKSLGKKFRNLPAISSVTVLPGGGIGFVVNIEDLVRAWG